MTDARLVPLSPVTFIERAADVFPEKLATVSVAGRSETYATFRAEARRVATRLGEAGVGRGEPVAVLARNGADALRMHYAVPGMGGALVALNTRLAPEEYAYILDNSEARMLFVEPALRHRIERVRHQLRCQIVDLPDADTGAESPPFGTPYGEWIAIPTESEPALQMPADELQPIAINYTSGTTGRPRGAIYTHRGAYLNALGVALELGMGPLSTYLWTLPMFHCNGWCCTWAATAVGATHVTLADFDPAAALRLIGAQRVSHLSGAPVVLTAIADEGMQSALHFDHDVRIATGGAAPAPTTISAMRALGVDVVHLYGLTETYGPSLICEVQPEWAGLDAAALGAVLARQGVRTVNVEAVRVVNDALVDVPRDGETIGEIVIRSNTVAAGYHNDPEATREAMRDGWLRTGDLAVVHPDGYVEVRDRSKDVIISGGENISSIEVENVLVAHPAVLEAAVVAAPHEQWGEVPVAYVTVKPGAVVAPEELIGFVRDRLAHFKAPKAVSFQDLPKTSTGKIQKYELRLQSKSLNVG